LNSTKSSLTINYPEGKMQKIKFSTLAASLLLLVLTNTFGSSTFKSQQSASQRDFQNDSQDMFGAIFSDRAEARSSGGRTGGGSFRRSPSPSNSPSRTYSAPIQPNRSGGNTIIAPIFIPGSGGYNNNPGYNNNSGFNNNSGYNSGSSTGGGIILLLVLLGIGGTGYLVYRLLKGMNVGGSGIGGGSELSNNKVTISKLQVGLLAEARAIQHELSEISLGADTDTPEGLVVLLQEAAIALLRTPENWVYVSASSEATDRDRAEGLFNSLSVAERSKFSAETLVNVNGRVRNNQNYKAKLDRDPAAYIVVTLLVGTEYDRPLFDRVNSRETLQAALEKMAGVSPEALSIFELLWTPQSESDALSSDEMLTEYTDMVAI
jgi:uncharacterized membrane protein